jgi:hypothetical protein
MNVKNISASKTENLELLVRSDKLNQSGASKQSFKTVLKDKSPQRLDLLEDEMLFDTESDSADEITMQIDDLISNIDWDSDDDEIDNFLADVRSGSNVPDDLAFLGEFDYE